MQLYTNHALLCFGVTLQKLPFISCRMDRLSFAAITNTCYCHVHCFCSLCDGAKPCYFVAIIIILRNTSYRAFIFFCDFIPVLFRVRFLTKKESVRISSFAIIDSMNDGKSKFLFCLKAAFKLLNEISIKVILIDRLSLPCHHVAVVQVILIGTPFKVLGSIVSLDFIYMIDNQPFLVTRNEVQGNKPMHFVVFVISMPVA